MLYMTGEETGWHLTSCAAGELYCSETAPSASGWWFNPSTFEVKYSDDSGASWDDYKLSMPIAIVTSSAAAFTSIDSVLQNFTFWGTYLMVRSGVKVLASAGRNQNGTLNNENLTSVLGGLNYSFSGSAQAYFGYGKEAGNSNLSVFCADVKDYHYNAEKNTIKLTNDEWVAAVCGSGQITNGKITYLEEKETLRVGDSGPVVTETYGNDLTGYRVWSNGFCEQWMYILGTTSDYVLTLELLKPYKSSSAWNVQISADNAARPANLYGGIDNAYKTSSTLVITTPYNNATVGFFVYTAGYIE